MVDCVSNTTSMTLKGKFHVPKEKLVDATYHKSVIDALQCLTFTRLDIQHAINKVYQIFNNLIELHIRIAKRFLHYLKRTQDYGL